MQPDLGLCGAAAQLGEAESDPAARKRQLQGQAQSVDLCNERERGVRLTPCVRATRAANAGGKGNERQRRTTSRAQRRGRQTGRLPFAVYTLIMPQATKGLIEEANKKAKPEPKGGR